MARIHRSLGNCWFFVALALPGPAGPALAGDPPVETDAHPNSLSAGSWSLQFRVTEELSLKPFDGLLVSVKRHLTERSAVRLGIDLNLYADDSENNRSSVQSDTLRAEQRQTTDRNNQGVSASVIYQYYPHPGARMNFYFGAGPLMRFLHSRSTTEQTYTSESDTQRTWVEDRASSRSLGALGVIGAEWFATKSISLHAEYRGSLAYTYRKSERESTDLRDYTRTAFYEDETHGWRFDAEDVILGISLYF